MRYATKLLVLVLSFSAAFATASGFEIKNRIEPPELSAAADFWVSIMDHVVFQKTPIVLDLVGVDYIDNTAGVASVIFTDSNLIDSVRNAPDDLGLDTRSVYPLGFLRVLGAPSEPERDHDAEIRLDTGGVGAESNKSIDSFVPTDLAGTIFHETLHVLGLTARLNVDGSYRSSQDRPTRFSWFAYSQGRFLRDMTQTEREAVGQNGLPVFFNGEISAIYGAEFYTAGVDPEIGPQLFSADLQIGHLSANISPNPVFASAGGHEFPAWLGAAMLSDMGLGDMLDTQVTQVGEGEGLTLSIITETLQSNLPDLTDIVVTLDAPEGVVLSLSSTGGATCTINTVNSLVCDVDSYSVNDAQTIAIDATSSDIGIYDVDVRIDHNAMHVDGDPFNNRLSATVTVGSNPLSAISLDAASIDEGTAINAQIGTVSVANSSSSAVTYRLVAGAGDTGNGLVSLTEDGVLTVSGTLDHETTGLIALRVQALAANGFSTIESLTQC